MQSHLGDFCSLSGRDEKCRDPEEADPRVGPASVVELTVCIRMLQALLRLLSTWLDIWFSYHEGSFYPLLV